MNAQIASKYRHRLLATVSSLALLGSVQTALAGDRPPVWIEFNWQFDKLNGMGDPYLPPFADKIVQDGFKSPAFAQSAIPYAYGAGGSLSFKPEGSDWIFSASIRYGRSHGSKSTHGQTSAAHHVKIGSNTAYLSTGYFRRVVRFSETHASNSEAHAILDFQAGKDIGVGLFGGGSTSTVNFGLRFAQFNSKRSVSIHADPDFYVPYQFLKYAKYHHTYSVTSRIDRSFQGLGPSLSWNSSVPIAGNPDDGGINLDWGVNVAALFGRKKVSGHHQTDGALYKTKFQKYYNTTPIHRSGNPDRSRNVVVPNVGAFAGISFRYSDAKISFGYRGDFFFGAMDGGIDTAKKTNATFNGPYASISVGIGD